MSTKIKSNKKTSNKLKDNFIGFYTDEEMKITIQELRIKLDLESDSQLMRYAIKRLQREHILNNVEVAK